LGTNPDHSPSSDATPNSPLSAQRTPAGHADPTRVMDVDGCPGALDSKIDDVPATHRSTRSVIDRDARARPRSETLLLPWKMVGHLRRRIRTENGARKASHVMLLPVSPPEGSAPNPGSFAKSSTELNGA